MPYRMTQGTALPLGPQGQNEAPPLPSSPPCALGRAVAGRARYVGAVLWSDEYECCLAVFVDPKTGLLYAQPVGG